MAGKLINVLLAEESTRIASATALLGEGFNAIAVASVRDAMAVLGKLQLDAILCGVAFDDSQMLDLLRAAQAHPAASAIPFVCFHDLPSPLGDVMGRTLTRACAAMGAVAFVDMQALRTALGPDAAALELRTTLARVVADRALR